MTDPQQALQALIQGGDAVTAFPPTSRYHGIGVTSLKLPDGRTVVYLKRRLVPPPENFTDLREHKVQQGERLDLIAAQHLGDPELFWRLCDANGVLDPAELEEPGRIVRITLPENLTTGGPDA